MYVTESRRKLHTHELHSWYPQRTVISVTKSRMMRWAGYTAHTGDEKVIPNLMEKKKTAGKRPDGDPGRK